MTTPAAERHQAPAAQAALLARRCIWILETFAKAERKLTRGNVILEHKVKKSLRALALNASNLQRTKMEGARRQVYRTRVDDDVRLIDEPLNGAYRGALAALYVGRHDDALRWGERYHEDTVQLVQRAALFEPDPREVPPKLQPIGKVVHERLLKFAKVPREALQAVAELTDLRRLPELRLPDEVAERVANYYTALEPAPHISSPVPAVQAPPAVALPVDRLGAVLRIPLHKFFAKLTDEQRRLAARPGSNLAVIKGAAGTGKTIVGIRRIEHWLKDRPVSDRPILFTCFNRVLAHAVEEMLASVLGGPLRKFNVQVLTAYQLLTKVHRELTGESSLPFRPVGSDALLPLIAEARTAAPATALRGWTDNMILDEVLEVILGRALVEVGEYLAAGREGRGVGLGTAARQQLWSVYEAFRRVCQRERVAPWDQIAPRVLHLLRRSPPTEPRFAGVVVDEVQDLSPAFLRAMVALQAGQTADMLVLGDAAQNVYRSGFTWKHAGISVAGGQVTILRECHRTTKPIVQAALPLLERQAERLADDLVRPETMDERGEPVRRQYFDNAEEEWRAIAICILDYLEHGFPVGSIGILIDDAERSKALRRVLRQCHIPVEIHYKGRGEKRIDMFAPSVKVLTTMSAKGLEFPILFLPALVEARFPTRDVPAEVADRSRRALYTAMLRAGSLLQITAVRDQAAAVLSELDEEYVFDTLLVHRPS